MGDPAVARHAHQAHPLAVVAVDATQFCLDVFYEWAVAAEQHQQQGALIKRLAVH